MMIKQIRTVCCTIVFLGLQLLACCHADLHFFGDSLSEAGNFSVATGGALPPAPLYFNGRFSDGAIWNAGRSPGADQSFAAANVCCARPTAKSTRSPTTELAVGIIPAPGP